MTQLPDLTTLLQDMVRIPSVSPGDGALSDSPHFGERRLADYVVDYLRGAGATPVVEDVHPDRPAVWAILDAGCERTLMLEAHMDTVAPDPSDPDPFSGALRDGRVYGRGACDCKGPLAVFLDAFRQAASGDPADLGWNLVIAAVPDEEHALTGSLHVARRLGDRVHGVICGEPTGLVPMATHKGVLRWRIRVDGTAAHSSTPHLGRNAIYAAGPLIGAIAEYADCLAAAPLTDSELGAPTASLVEIHGGVAVNVVPPDCELLIDRRILPDEDVDIEEARLKEILARRAPAETWTLSRIETHCKPLRRCPADAPLLTALQGALADEGLPGEAGALQCGTDAPNFAAVGVTALVWGPGDIRLAHCIDECINVTEMEKAGAVLRRLLARRA